MKVRDLINKLNQHDPNAEIILDGDDNGWLEIDDVDLHLWENPLTGELEQMVSIERVY